MMDFEFWILDGELKILLDFFIREFLKLVKYLYMKIKGGNYG
jgi:hypothetical protein